MTANQIYQEMQKEWVKLIGLKEGDTVKITREWKNGEQGFKESHPCRKERVGESFKVVGVIDTHIILGGHNVPYFVLEKVDVPSSVRLGERELVKNSEGYKCGCCELTKKELQEAVRHFDALSEQFAGYSFGIVVEGTSISRDDIAKIKELI